MSDKVAGFVSFLIALVIGCLIAGAGIAWGEHGWRDEIHGAGSPPGWITRSGTITEVGRIEYGNSPPARLSNVVYRDYQGYQHDVKINMPIDTTHVGEKINVDVHNDEQIWVPAAVDNHNMVQYDGWPQDSIPVPGIAGNHKEWPWLGILLGGLVGMTVFGLTWNALYVWMLNASDRWSGRLGTR